MRRRTRQISLKECYAILKLEKNADLAAVKRAYRRRAFELHPDLNPGNAEASRDFQLLNEAYVALSGILTHEDEVRKKSEARQETRKEARQEARKSKKESAGAKDPGPADAKQEDKSASQPPPSGEDTAKTAGSQEKGQNASQSGTAQGGQNSAEDKTSAEDQAESSRADAAGAAYAEQDVLRDLLNDPFARRVFEDIYSELNKQQAEKAQQEEPQQQEAESAPQNRAKPKAAKIKKNAALHKENLAGSTATWSSEMARGVTGMVKDWLRRQIDEEQSLTLPASNLAPGCRVRLQIRQGLQAELKTVEITLPPDFSVGRPVRLRGLGKRVGPWQGDLYLTLYTE
ncbi:J domain-containing protein [Desulfovibrio sp. 86]|uniref:Heat shock protein DnaJ domain protein n=1 Tax=uncultured Desulfovibrio sp. TaxID=167968 RepID=A0A212KZP4_9BACT|nr:J domain-containing protein [Desulfovibrio sp. 86]SCM70717.1 Heat shock protein DnaJ domain protein [uncultured Desulfovibrio sp.]VZH32458.1 Heat shock protein DnaJ domain protein [Desulfovibrio sp. 86]